MKKLLIFILSAILTVQATANENALNVLNEVNLVFKTKEDAITLEQAKEMAAGENIDIAIAYERLFQAQRKIGQARANYFPYGVGDALLIYFTNAFSTLILVELATSLPTKWYFVQKQKHLRNAEAFNYKSLRENIKNQIASMYYGILNEEAMLKLTGYELKLMEELATSLEAQVALGLADADKLQNLKWRTLRLRDEYLKFEAYLSEEKMAYKTLLNMDYKAEINLQPVSNFLSQDAFTIDVETLARTAQERSFEVKSSQEMVNAAYDSRNSTRWSILSFGGIGFNYFARIRVDGSKVDESILRRDAVRDTVYTNTYTREKMFRNSVDYFLSEKKIADTTKGYMKANLADFKAGNIALSELIESELYFLRDYRQMISAHYSALTRLDDLERVVLGKVNATEFSADDITIKANKNRKKTTISLESDIDMAKVKSVTYTIAGLQVQDIKTFNEKSNFAIKLKNKYLSEVIEGSALIIFDNGEVLKKNFSL